MVAYLMSLPSILSAGAKYKVAFVSRSYPDEHLNMLPIWHHLHRKPNMRRCDNSANSRCLRNVHGISTVKDTILAAACFDHPDHRQNNSWCDCDGCPGARLSGCSTPNLCFKHAKKLLNMLHEDFIPRTQTPLPQSHNDTLQQLNRDSPDISWFLFDHSMDTVGDISHNFRIDPLTSDIVQLPPDTTTPGAVGTTPYTHMTTAYVQHYCIHPHLADASAGTGIWFGPNIPQCLSSGTK